MDYSLEVYNTSGQLVKAFSSLSQDQSISIEDLTASIYYIRTISGGHAETIRIVKM
ncbi:MAG: T9SS type A sorting domain-containing protein [Saprospiraceae bacterium]|nr:T9SS type A sorting domain-containing protein [Saprospiraceae bacterium]